MKHSIERYRDIEAESEIKFFEEVGFLRICQRSDPRLDDVNNLVHKLENEGVVVNNVDDQYSKEKFSYLR